MSWQADDDCDLGAMVLVGITCFDGVGCIGGNKILLEDGSARLFFDFGTNFGAVGRYYEEYLQPKTCAGLYEPLYMGMLPPFNDLYRSDLVTAHSNPWDQIEAVEVGEVGGVLVSHAHVDHMGAVRFLRTDIPIYCTPVTAAIARALQDTGRGASMDEYCYYIERTDDPDKGVTTPNYRTTPAIGRKYCLTKLPGCSEFDQFWHEAPSSRELNACACTESCECAGLPVKNFQVDHSVFGASAWAVETSAGWVVYSGDIRFHGTYGGLSQAFAEEAAKLKPAAMIIEGTRIKSSSRHTETDVGAACMDEVKKCSGLVIADFGPRNVERLISFLEIARQTGRHLAVMPKDVYLLEAMRCADGDQVVPPIDSPEIRLYCEYEGTTNKWKARLKEKYQDRIVTPNDISINQDKFICCFSFWDVNELAYIRPIPDSIWIYSSCEAINEEMEIDMARLKNWLNYFGVKLIGSDLEKDIHFHVSGHASGSDLMELVRTARPQNLIPIHTEHPEVYCEAVGDICNVIVPERGMQITL